MRDYKSLSHIRWDCKYKNRKLFPTDDSAKKVIYLAIQAASLNGQCQFITGKKR